MKRSRGTSLIALALVGSALLLPSAGQAQVSVNETDSLSGGVYTYHYSVTNNSPTELAFINIPVLADPTNVQNPVAPGGFQISFDPNLGIVTFLDGTAPDTFAPGSTVSGFSFQSPFAPGGTFFDGQDINGVPFAGPTSGPGSVPEPGTLALSMTLVSGFSVTLLRRKRA